MAKKEAPKKEARATIDAVREAWSEKVGRSIQFETVEVQTVDGRKQTHLINPETGSVVVAVNATGEKALQVLVDNPGVTFIDEAFTLLETEGYGAPVGVDNSLGAEPQQQKRAAAQPGPVFPESDERSGVK